MPMGQPLADLLVALPKNKRVSLVDACMAGSKRERGMGKIQACKGSTPTPPPCSPLTPLCIQTPRPLLLSAPAT